MSTDAKPPGDSSTSGKIGIVRISIPRTTGGAQTPTPPSSPTSGSSLRSGPPPQAAGSQSGSGTSSGSKPTSKPLQQAENKKPRKGIFTLERLVYLILFSCFAGIVWGFLYISHLLPTKPAPVPTPASASNVSRDALEKKIAALQAAIRELTNSPAASLTVTNYVNVTNNAAAASAQAVPTPAVALSTSPTSTNTAATPNTTSAPLVSVDDGDAWLKNTRKPETTTLPKPADIKSYGAGATIPYKLTLGHAADVSVRVEKGWTCYPYFSSTNGLKIAYGGKSGVKLTQEAEDTATQKPALYVGVEIRLLNTGPEPIEVTFTLKPTTTVSQQH